MNRYQQEQQDEILARSRRIETRLTSLLVAQGIDTPTQKPKFEMGTLNASVELPSPHTSIGAVVACIPNTCHETVAIYVGDDHVGWFTRS